MAARKDRTGILSFWGMAGDRQMCFSACGGGGRAFGKPKPSSRTPTPPDMLHRVYYTEPACTETSKAKLLNIDSIRTVRIQSLHPHDTQASNGEGSTFQTNSIITSGITGSFKASVFTSYAKLTQANTCRYMHRKCMEP